MVFGILSECQRTESGVKSPAGPQAIPNRAEMLSPKANRVVAWSVVAVGVIAIAWAQYRRETMPAPVLATRSSEVLCVREHVYTENVSARWLAGSMEFSGNVMNGCQAPVIARLHWSTLNADGSRSSGVSLARYGQPIRPMEKVAFDFLGDAAWRDARGRGHGRRYYVALNRAASPDQPADDWRWFAGVQLVWLIARVVADDAHHVGLANDRNQALRDEAVPIP